MRPELIYTTSVGFFAWSVSFVLMHPCPLYVQVYLQPHPTNDLTNTIHDTSTHYYHVVLVPITIIISNNYYHVLKYHEHPVPTDS